MKRDIDRLMAERNLDWIIVEGPDGFAGANPDYTYLTNGEQLTGAQVVSLAAEQAARLELGPGDRVLSTLSFDDWAGLGGGLLAPLAAGGSVVLCRNSEKLADEAKA